jgi:glycosyltransferase involved in cell wall biosynthesis
MHIMVKRLLFITQRLDENDRDLAFAIQWVDAFRAAGYEVQVICLKKGTFDDHFPVFSLGKEKGWPKWRWIIEFYRLIFTLRYDRVFVHMNSEWSALGGWYWWLTRRPFYLWYTHYTMTWHLRVTGLLVTKMFCATSQSLPQYNNSPKKVVVGHGIDVPFWTAGTIPDREERDPYALVTVHRLSRSKRLELVLRALSQLPAAYHLTVYGRIVPGEEQYASEMQQLIVELGLQQRARILEPVSMTELRSIYRRYALMLNMASETIDKTMLEAMLNGCYVVTTPGNSQAIGLVEWPQDEGIESLVEFVNSEKWKAYSAQQLQGIVIRNHSLSSLITKMNV